MFRWKKPTFNLRTFWNGLVHPDNNLQKRFIVRVLAPPFIILLLLGAIGLWQLDRFVRGEAVGELKRSANTTAAKLEREFAVREKVLKSTGDELMAANSEYLADREQLGRERAGCVEHIKKSKSPQGSPGDVCEPFLIDFARRGVNLQAIEDGYVRADAENRKGLSESIDAIKNTYTGYFPETLAIVVVDDKKQSVSNIVSDVFDGSSELLLPHAHAAISAPAVGKISTSKDVRYAVFAYPLDGKGSVLAAYNLDDDGFIKDTWESTPIDKDKSLAVILDSSGKIAYPNLALSNNFEAMNKRLRDKASANVNIKDVNHVAAGGVEDSSKWQVVVASPANSVLAPLRDAQIAAVLIIGLLLIGFLWVGTYFIQKTIHSIIILVSGALVFASGKLDYKINLPRADQEFVSLADSMNNMAERIAKAEKELDEKNKEFISVATHELRTPLTAIIGNLSMIKDDFSDKIDASVKPMVDQVHASTIRLRDLVNDMLDVARMEGGREKFEIAPQDIQSIARGVVDNLQITAHEKNITLEYNDTGAASVMADEARLRIVLNNFVSNAIKYNRSDGFVRVAHSMKDGKLVTSIADTGLGIPEDQKAHMFEKFFRVDHEDRKNVVGTGLGMYITREYVLNMRGDVWFDSTHGKGTTFYFSLPVAAAAPTPAAVPTPPSPTPMSPTVAPAPSPAPVANSAAVVPQPPSNTAPTPGL